MGGPHVLVTWVKKSPRECGQIANQSILFTIHTRWMGSDVSCVKQREVPPGCRIKKTLSLAALPRN